MLITSAGLWNAAAGNFSPCPHLAHDKLPAAFLPSSFAMYLVTLAFAYSLEAPSLKNYKRTFTVTLLFAVSAVFGWPFSLALAIPFVFEELFVAGDDIVLPATQFSWMIARCRRLLLFGSAASVLFVSVVHLFNTFSLNYYHRSPFS
jgi:alpha-1,2-mannosyltransferase